MFTTSMSQQPCYICNKPGVYRYAPYDFEKNWPENKRWRCEEHRPYDATEVGWNGEWDIIESTSTP